MTLVVAPLAGGVCADDAALRNRSAGTLVPVEPMRRAPQPLHPSSPATADRAAPQQNLRWRASSQVAPPSDPGQINRLRPLDHPPRLAPVQQVTYLRDPAGAAPREQFDVPPTGDGAFPPRMPTAVAPDPFLDPFNDGQALIQAPRQESGEPSISIPPVIELPIPGEDEGPDLLIPQDGQPRNPQAQDAQPQDAQPQDAQPQDAQPQDAQPQAQPQASPSDVPGQQLAPPNIGILPPISGADGPADNPFSQNGADGSPRELDSSTDRESRLRQLARGEDCDEQFVRAAAQTIQQVSLDISPPFRPDILAQDAFQEARAEFLEEQSIRVWRSRSGRVLAEGRLVDLAYENAIVETEGGVEVEIPLAKLANPDLAYVTEAWELPFECQLPDVPFEPRQWLPITMTWKASNLCHKPLYFEDVNLERYGHTAGPFAQPVVSTAHFFFNIAVLPYKMGIHPPGECQYALGYYRPGSCAPWIIPPVPLSLRGALAEAAVIGGGFALVP